MASPTRRLEENNLLPNHSSGPSSAGSGSGGSSSSGSARSGLDDLDSEDEFDVPSFLK
jgi:hypothetical protein